MSVSTAYARLGTECTMNFGKIHEREANFLLPDIISVICSGFDKLTVSMQAIDHIVQGSTIL